MMKSQGHEATGGREGNGLGNSVAQHDGKETQVSNNEQNNDDNERKILEREHLVTL
jgi:hypothetical protein